MKRYSKKYFLVFCLFIMLGGFGLIRAAMAASIIFTNNAAITEGVTTTDAFKIMLGSQPSADVDVSISATTTNHSLTDIYPQTFHFTPGNYDQQQSIDIKPAADQFFSPSNDGSLSATVSSSDTDYNGLTAIHSFSFNDLDVPGITISTSSLELDDNGQGQLLINLTSKPLFDVSLYPINILANLVATPNPVVFTPDNWNVPQTLAVSDVSQSVYKVSMEVEGNSIGLVDFILMHTSSSDPVYGSGSIFGSNYFESPTAFAFYLNQPVGALNPLIFSTSTVQADAKLIAGFDNNNDTLYSYSLTDINNDGHLDFIALFRTAGNVDYVDVMLGDGQGTLGDAITSNILSTTNNGSFSKVADFNNDGKKDLLLAANNISSSTADYYISYGNGDGTFNTAQPIYETVASDMGTKDADVGDFNKDGNQDIVLIDAVSSTVSRLAVLIGNGDGTFHDPVFYESDSLLFYKLVAKDMDNDGNIDLEALKFDGDIQNITGYVSVLKGNGDGTFNLFSDQPLHFPSQTLPMTMNVDDINGDGQADVVLNVVNFTNGESNLYSFPGLGNGNLSAPTVMPLGFLNPFSLFIDINNDGLLDLVSPSVFQFSALYINDGSSNFRKIAEYQSTALTGGDLNGDGLSDIIMQVSNGSSLYAAPVLNALARPTSTTATASNNSAVIAWQTDLSGATKVEYGTTAAYGSLTGEIDTSPKTTSHQISLTGLTACTSYHYRPISKNEGNFDVYGSDQTFNTTCSNRGASTARIPSAPPVIGSSPITATTHSSGLTINSSISNVNQIAIADNPDFTGISWESYAPNKQIDANSFKDKKYVYVKFRSPSGAETAVQKIDLISGRPIVSTPAATTPPKSSSATQAFVFTKQFRSGQIAPEIKQLQKYLNSHGFLVAKSGLGSKGRETTKFGAGTRLALIRFQKANKLKPSGILDSNTIKKLNDQK